jgi:ASC-1-like (ASCH) protein
MDQDEQRSFILFLAKEMKLYCRELMAYQLFAEMLKENGIEGVDQMLEKARNSPAIQARFQRQFEGFDELLPPSREELEELAWQELLKDWKPSGRPN